MSDTATIGLPPRAEDSWTPPSAADLWKARGINLFGLVSPAANLGMVFCAPKDLRWMGVGAGLVCGIAFLWGHHGGIDWLLYGGAALHYGLVALGLLHPRWPEHPAQWWIEFGKLLGKVMIFPLFAILYYLAVTPTALLVRVFGSDPLERKAPPADSYWTPHEPPAKDRYKRQF